MPEINLNKYLAEILTNHGISVKFDEDFIQAILSSEIKLKARAIYQEINETISSQLDVLTIAPNGYEILESFGDTGKDIETAITNNFNNFSSGTIHPLLSAFGYNGDEVDNYVTIENWEINNKKYIAHIGNITCKANKTTNSGVDPTVRFFNVFEEAVRSQTLSHQFHWFRGYYLQYQNQATSTEFLMDNKTISTGIEEDFSSIPVIPDVDYYSCRIFAILKEA